MVESEGQEAIWRKFVNSTIAAEAAATLRYFDECIQILRRKEDSGLLLQGVSEQCPQTKVYEEKELFSSEELHLRRGILLNGNFNHTLDIQGLLENLHKQMSRSDRVIAIAYNPYLRALYALANFLGVRKGEMPSTFLTQVDLDNIAQLAGFEVSRVRPCVYSPLPLAGIGSFLNKIIPCIPVLRWLSFAAVFVLRPIKTSPTPPSVTVLIPARNEKGNIENAVQRLPKFSGAAVELLFVEGNSSDGTWEEIQRVQAKYKESLDIQVFQQPGKGKSDAVRHGFAHAKNDLLMILDADLTMPPEQLERFYEAWISGKADFVNGNRLVYPMEGEAMRFLNKLGNKFFAKALSIVLGVRLGDSLCGTKVFTRSDYQRFTRWRNDFGDVDPFGDFELLFPASELGLGIINLPVAYKDRTYGSTNISRFRHGWMLLQMTWIGFWRLENWSLFVMNYRRFYYSAFINPARIIFLRK